MLGYSQLGKEFEANLGYRRTCLKKVQQILASETAFLVSMLGPPTHCFFKIWLFLNWSGPQLCPHLLGFVYPSFFALEKSVLFLQNKIIMKVSKTNIWAHSLSLNHMDSASALAITLSTMLKIR